MDHLNIGIEPTSNWTRIDSPHKTVTAVAFSSQQLRVKDAGDANWKEAVAFTIDGEENGYVYVRSVDDFLSKYVNTDNWQEGRP